MGAATVGAAATPGRIAGGTPEHRRLQAAMLAAALAAFALLYATQALLPEIGTAFGVDATLASLTVSVTTGVTALAVLPMSAWAERAGRTRVMALGLSVACLAVLAGSLAPDFWLLLVARAVDGIALAGVVAVAMGHIGDEVNADASGATIGVYVSGTTLGGLVGRLLPAGVEGFGGWRWSLVALALLGGACTLVFTRLVPPSRRPVGAPGGSSRAATLAHLRDPGIVRLCLVALLLMGGFVATYNYLTYRLVGAPFGLATSTIGLVFIAYLSGTISSTVAARAAARVGSLPVLLASITISLAGLGVTLADDLVAVLAGLVAFTAGFFGAHSVASGWITSRAATRKSQASALYLMAYYLGSSVGGTAIGFAWSGGGWPATVAAVAGCFVLAGIVALGISAPPREPEPEALGRTELRDEAR